MATVKTTGRVAMTNIDTGEIFGMWDGEQAITIRSVEDYEKAKTKGEVAQSKNDKLSTISKSYWDYGRFFWSLYDTASALFSQLKPATLTRIMVLGTYMNYENELVEDNGVTMTQLGIQNALGVSERMTRYTMDALALYLNDRGGGNIVALNKYIQAASKLRGFESEAMKDEVHRTGVLKL